MGHPNGWIENGFFGSNVAVNADIYRDQHQQRRILMADMWRKMMRRVLLVVVSADVVPSIAFWIEGVFRRTRPPDVVKATTI